MNHQPKINSKKTPEIGAHLSSPRCGFSHHGIYVGDGRVIHYSGLCRGFHFGPVEEVSLDEFSQGNGFDVVQEASAAHSAGQTAERARSRLGENDYSLLNNNCEHFCSWCECGEARSPQIEAVAGWANAMWSALRGEQANLSEITA